MTRLKQNYCSTLTDNITILCSGVSTIIGLPLKTGQNIKCNHRIIGYNLFFFKSVKIRSRFSGPVVKVTT